MFRVMDIDSAGRVIETEGEAFVHPPPAGTLRWIDLEKQDPAQLELLGSRFKFHPLTMEDCAHFDQRPKVEEYEGYLFIVTHGFSMAAESDAELQTCELHTFLGDRYLVTVHDGPIRPMSGVWGRVKIERGLSAHGADFVSYLVADAMVDMLFPLVDKIATDVEALEESILEHAQSQHTLERILGLRRALVHLRKVLVPQRDVFARLSKRGEGLIAERTALYFRDVHDHLLRIAEAVDATRDLLGNALDAYLWTGSQRTNEIMKRLTLLSAIFMPLAFITGFFGQNFADLPFDSRTLFFGMLLGCAFVPAGMLYFFSRSKWF
jgi:magnesium transporter